MKYVLSVNVDLKREYSTGIWYDIGEYATLDCAITALNYMVGRTPGNNTADMRLSVLNDAKGEEQTL